VLVDFGTGTSIPRYMVECLTVVAMPKGADHERLIQPEALRSPEVLLGCTWDTKADIWNFGCIVRIHVLLENDD